MTPLIVATSPYFRYAFAAMNTKALLAAAIVGLAGAGLLYVYMKRFEARASGGPPVAVVMATQDIPLGAVITRQVVGIRSLPAAYVEGRHIRAQEAKDILGVRVASRVKANESVLWTDLATTTEQRRDLSSLVRTGRRAKTIQADSSSTMGGLLQPGDRVDVLLTTGEHAQKEVTVPLLQNVLVLAVGTNTGAETASGRRRSRRLNQVTLSLTVDQASIVTFATRIGALSLTLRNPDDIAIIESLPETGQDDILEPERRRVLIRREKDEGQTLPKQIQ